ncbi:phage tail protein [Leifsonia naganoensis]|uniref:Microcystin-dependent protein n=1 Tax=Leifsonia naganoensis TaxID=150025 RepID=A0A853DP33_9MICO|nr:tail fiber protein [Leifsonia naganoensis]NYK10238.1 microcystin-dependent protein [Leifsonia naganoensis]
MANSYVGEIRMFAGTFEPAGWMFCRGQLISIADYETLFNLLGTTYGGDGQSTFGLPDLGARFPVHQGTSSSGRQFTLGQMSGADQVTVNVPQLPVHTHAPTAAAAPTTASASGAVLAGWADAPFTSATPSTALALQQLAPTGGSQPHENRQPYVTVSFIISLFGIYPSPS